MDRILSNKVNNHHGYKTFLQLLEIVHSKPSEGKKFIQDGRLSSQEKKLLTFYFQMREKNYGMLSEISKDISFTAYPFLNGLRFYFLGIAHLYRADSKTGEEYIHQAIPLMGESYNERFFAHLTFRTHINLYYAHVNLKRLDEACIQFETIKTLLPQNKEDEINLKLTEVCHYLMMNQYAQAEEILDELQAFKGEMYDSQLLNFLTEKFDFLIKVENFVQAKKVLAEIKSLRIFRSSANYNYMDTLLRYVASHEAIYFYDSDFEGHNDLLRMIKVIKALDEKDLEGAKAAWAALQQIAPATYKNDFVYAGDKCLFSLCLQKFISTPTVEYNKDLYTQQELKIIQIIQDSAGSQIRKEDLFFKIYGKQLDSKDELGSLTAAIYRMNKKGGLSINSKKGCYYLENTARQVS